MIAIKNMEMPKACYRCPLLDGEYGTCNIDGIGETEIDMTEERASDCPLVEVEEQKIEKLGEIEQIIKQHDNDILPENYWYIYKIKEVLKQE